MSGRIVLGLVLVVLGVGLALDAADRIDFGQVFETWWPLILIFVGVAHLATSRGSAVGPAVLIGVGAFFLAKNLGYLGTHWARYLPALLLVVVGILLLVPRRGRDKWVATSTTHQESLQRTAFLGGFDERVNSRPFRGGSVNAFMGGGKLDLRGAELPPEGATLEANATLGGIEILVPAKWAVELDARPMLGGVDNRTLPPPDASAPVLRIRASAFMGSVEVKN